MDIELLTEQRLKRLHIRRFGHTNTQRQVLFPYVCNNGCIHTHLRQCIMNNLYVRTHLFVHVYV